jgi:hygromycin-B 4-O-kinase
MSGTPAPEVHQLARFLTDRFGSNVRDVRPLGAGKWSRAFAFDTDDSRLVLRLGDHEEDFAKDRIAASWQQPGLPVPGFLEMGEAFGAFYAVTERADGRFLDGLTRTEVNDVFPSVLRVLDALRRVQVPGSAGFGGWSRHGVGEHSSWKDALLTLETARPRIDGWKHRLQRWPQIQRAFDEGVEHLHVLTDQVPSRRDVIHRDLVNRNVLVAGAEVTSVFDWGCSMYGDHLYDVAWLTFCASYTTGFDRSDVHRRARAHYAAQGIAPDDFDLRINCYELHIGLGALIYRAFLGEEAHAQALAIKIQASSVPDGTTVRLRG